MCRFRFLANVLNDVNDRVSQRDNSGQPPIAFMMHLNVECTWSCLSSENVFIRLLKDVEIYQML